MENLVIVESPAKAKTINKYLGSDYKVLASFGHIRDLPPKDGSVDPTHDFAMTWSVSDGSEKHIKEIASALKDAKNLILASDPDREGEAIAWHVVEELGKRGKLKGKNIKRVTFNEITKNAVTAAIANPRDIDSELVDAYLARRALDYLVGFSLSPVLWRKLPGSRSAGRVQSVALRLICERENEIEQFKAEEYWTIKGTFQTEKKADFTALLTALNGKKLEKFTLNSEELANKAKEEIERHTFAVSDIDKKTISRNPAPPFTTSTLQQEASRKLGFSTKKTMQIAQGLYEGIDIGGDTVGLITYMRTDGVAMASEAINAAREQIAKDYGKDYLPDSPRYYKNTVKNAQEAHEAIRPTNMTRTPESVAKYLNKDQLKLYSMIYKRSIASQMQSAKFDKVSVTLLSEDDKIAFRAGGMTTLFDGFLKVYFEDFDDRKDDDEDDENRHLPPLSLKENTALKETLPEQHFTQAPPRYSEASLVKKLEELGIGRPSTYASIISVLQDREYVKLVEKRFIPEDRGRIVTTFLENFFSPYVQYDFTADMEDSLDKISEGKAKWKKVLSDFWTKFDADIKGAEKLTGTEVINKLEEALSAHIFPTPESKKCPLCADGKLNLKLGKYGAFIGCSNYPECDYKRPISDFKENAEENKDLDLGLDPATSEPVLLKKGPYGYYIQRGTVSKSKDQAAKSTGKRVSLPKGIAPSSVDLDTALALLSLPKTLGNHPTSGDKIEVGIGRFGAYVKMGKSYKSLTKDDNILTITLDRAAELLAAAPQKTTKDIGTHPETGEVISIGSGRFGPYVKMGKIYASIPKSIEGEPSLDEAVALLEAKAKKPAATKTKTKTSAKTKAKAKAKKK